MPTITDWLMVFITLIYVIATVLICLFNSKSAKAAREQVAEMRKQQDAEKRYNTLPWFLVSVEELTALPDSLENRDAYKEQEANAVRVMTSDSKDAVRLPLFRLTYSVRNIGCGTATKSRFVIDCPDGVSQSVQILMNRSLMSGESYSKTVYLAFSLPRKEYEKNATILTSASLIFKMLDINNCEHTQGAEIYFKLSGSDLSCETEVSNGTPSPL